MPHEPPCVRPSGTPFDRIARVHETPPRTVYHFAGAGACALAALHAVGGSSRTLLEAVDAYHARSLSDLLGGAPAASVAPEVARGLAERAYARACELVADDPGPSPVFGTGLTATIATDRIKRGDHAVEAATADAWGVRWRSLRPRKGARERAEEERLASAAVLGLLLEASGLLEPYDLPIEDDERTGDGFVPSERFRAFLDGAGPLWIAVDGRLGRPPASAAEATPALVSGSFHPMHAGHVRLADAAERYLGRPVAFETSPRNAEKKDLDANALRIRAVQAAGRRPLVLLHEPLFADKAERLPGTVFVIGVDTAERVVDPRFYGGAAGRARAFGRIRAAGASFLVAGRTGRGRFRELSDLDLPEDGVDLFTPLPSFRVDLSSTEIRSSWPAESHGRNDASSGHATSDAGQERSGPGGTPENA